MQNALCFRCRHLYRLQSIFVRHASKRAFEKPLSTPVAKRNALPPAKRSPQNAISKELRQPPKDRPQPVDPDFNTPRDRSFFTLRSADRRPIFPPLPPWLKRWLTPWKIFFYAIIGYTGYRLYNWQINPSRDSVLNLRYFYPFIIESREPVSSTSAVISLQNYPLGQNADRIKAAWKTGVWSVQVCQPELQIARSYSPLPPTSDDMPNELIRLFVREEPKGEVSRMLHRTPAGSIMQLRGPFPEFEVPDGLKEVVFLAGGTGIAPALQVAYCLYIARGLKEEEWPRMRILWANRRREDSRNLNETEEVQQWRTNLWNRVRYITGSEGVKQRDVRLAQGGKLPDVEQTRLVDEVEQLVVRTGGKVSVEYFVDEEGSFINERLLRSYLMSAESKTDSSDAQPSSKLVILSGPDGFINHYAGPKVWEGGKERPGPLGGVLKKIAAPGWDVWSL